MVKPMSGRVRKGMMYASAALIASGTIMTAVSLHAEPLPAPLPTTVSVHVRPHATSIYRVQIVDPFAAQPDAASVAGAPQTIAQASGLSSAPGVVPKLGPLSVPNPDGSMPAGSPVLASDQTTTYTLQATLLGNPSIAEFQSGGDVELLKVGDMLGDRKVVRITKGEVDFADGTRISMAGGNAQNPSQSVPAAPMTAPGVAVTTAPGLAPNATPAAAPVSSAPPASPATAPQPQVFVTPPAQRPTPAAPAPSSATP